MSSVVFPYPPADAATPRRDRAPMLGALLITDALLSFAPVIVLGRAIGWPQSLGLPAAEQLSRIHAQPEAVAFGYGLYLLYSVLVAPVMIAMAARVFGGLHRPLAATVAAFAVLSTLARAIGILRWLTVMPALATAHAAADPATRVSIERLFDAVNAYGGGIGELLGVSLFMAASLGLLCIGALRQRLLPTWLASLGLVAAALLGSAFLPAVGVPLAAPMALAVSSLSVWMIAASVWALRKSRQP